jgi:hypothetical protein
MNEFDELPEDLWVLRLGKSPRLPVVSFLLL